MLPTDWGKPGTSAMQRLSDRRVRQYWDPEHMVAAALKASSTSPHPSCCDRKGILWDLTAAYPPGTEWRDGLPSPILFDGIIVRVAPQLEAAFANTK
jgi:hypothetical protein